MIDARSVALKRVADAVYRSERSGEALHVLAAAPGLVNVWSHRLCGVSMQLPLVHPSFCLLVVSSSVVSPRCTIPYLIVLAPNDSISHSDNRPYPLNYAIRLFQPPRDCACLLLR